MDKISVDIIFIRIIYIIIHKFQFFILLSLRSFDISKIIIILYTEEIY